MYIQEPKVEFVAIKPEMVTESSISCGGDVVYYCTDSAMESSGLVTCGCGNSIKDAIPEDF